MMEQAIIEFLLKLEEKLPPKPGAHHSITAGRYNGVDYPMLTIVLPTGFQTFYMQDGDIEQMDKTIDFVISELRI